MAARRTVSALHHHRSSSPRSRHSASVLATAPTLLLPTASLFVANPSDPPSNMAQEGRSPSRRVATALRSEANVSGGRPRTSGQAGSVCRGSVRGSSAPGLLRSCCVPGVRMAAACSTVIRVEKSWCSSRAGFLFVCLFCFVCLFVCCCRRLLYAQKP